MQQIGFERDPEKWKPIFAKKTMLERNIWIMIWFNQIGS
jgi:hypothetical protein